MKLVDFLNADPQPVLPGLESLNLYRVNYLLKGASWDGVFYVLSGSKEKAKALVEYFDDVAEVRNVTPLHYVTDHPGDHT